MAFCFKKKESVSKAVRRLGRGRIRHALACLKDCDLAEGIHGARRDIKKARAVLQLACGKIGKKNCRRITGLLRKAASKLAGPRDAFVMYRTLRNLRQHFEGQLAAGALSHVRRKLRRACDKAMKRFVTENDAKDVRRILRRAAKELEHLKLSSKGWRVLYPGVKKAYSAGQHAYQTVLNDPSPENFHKWRKHAKALWYQVSLLEPLWPEQMEAMESELETLGEHLGDYHDLAVLRQTIVKTSDHSGQQRELETLNGLIDERQRELLAEAMPLGARFYAERSSGFCERLAGYWQIWRGEKGPGINSAGTIS